MEHQIIPQETDVQVGGELIRGDFSFGYTEGSSVQQNSKVENIVNNIDNSVSGFGSLGSDGANTLVLALVALALIGIFGGGIYMRSKNKNKNKTKVVVGK